MANTGDMIREISTMLAAFSTDAQATARNGKTDRAKELERIVGQVLDIVLDAKLVDMNRSGPNFPDIDLGDAQKRIAVQVTVRSDRAKVQETLDGFLEDGLDGSFSRLIVVMLVAKVSLRGRVEPTDKSRAFSFNSKEDVWDLAMFEREIEYLDDGKIYQIYRYLDTQSQRLSASRAVKPTHLLPGLPALAGSFVEGSRDGELAALEMLVEAGEPVFIWGLGGMGKTQVAIQLGRRLASRFPGGVYFLRCPALLAEEKEALREMILQADFSGYRYDGPLEESREIEYRQRLGILRAEYAGAVLFIDNFDRAGRSFGDLLAEEAYRDLTQCGVQLVFTTRTMPEGAAQQEIGPISDAHLMTLMRGNGMKDAPEEDLLALIRAVEGHTMTVDLMAKTLARSQGRISVETMLQALRGDLDREEFPDVTSEHSRKDGQRRIYHHLKALFDLSAMNSQQRQVLRYAALLPDCGMDYLLFASSLPEKEEKKEKRGFFRRLFGKREITEKVEKTEKVLLKLYDLGWLTITDDASRQVRVLHIHPVVREVCFGELKPTDENCRNFLLRLWNAILFHEKYDETSFLQQAECFTLASLRLGDKKGDWSCFAGRFWDELGQAQQALECNLHMVSQCKKNLPADSVELATAYNNLGHSYNALGDYKKALEYGLMALEIRKRIYKNDHPDLAMSYDNVGVIYENLQDYEKALEYGVKAMEIRQKVLHSDHLDLAASYNNVGLTYNAMGEPKQAIEYERKALKIYEKVLAADHPSLANAYMNTGYLCWILGELEEGLEYQLKALAMQEKILRLDHPNRAYSYHNLGCTYYGMMDDEKALEYLEKALAIREKTLPPDHDLTKTTRDSIAIVKERLAQQEESPV